MLPTKEEKLFLDKYLFNGCSKWKILEYTAQELINIDETIEDHNNKHGKMGELYVWDCLREHLQDKGFRWNRRKFPFTYVRQQQYRKGFKGNGGIDHYLILRDENAKEYRCMIEISNWKAIQINDHIFETRIANKFTKYDRLDRCFHICAINKNCGKKIVDKCEEKGILIMYLRGQITRKYLSYIGYN